MLSFCWCIVALITLHDAIFDIGSNFMITFSLSFLFLFSIVHEPTLVFMFGLKWAVFISSQTFSFHPISLPQSTLSYYHNFFITAIFIFYAIFSVSKVIFCVESLFIKFIGIFDEEKFIDKFLFMIRPWKAKIIMIYL